MRRALDLIVRNWPLKLAAIALATLLYAGLVLSVGSGLQSKSVPVSPVVSGTPATGYEVESVTIEPVVVSVQGDSDAMTGLAKVDTLPVSVSGASTSLTREVALALPEGVEALSDDTVKVTVNVRTAKASRSMSVGVVLSGAQGDRTYSLSTPSVLVTLGGSAVALDSIDAPSLAAAADVEGLDSGSHAVKLRVALPDDVKLIAMSPSEITVTVVQNPTPVPSPSS